MIPFVYIAIILSVIGLLAATYTDLKARIVPNKLNYALALAGLIIFGLQSITESSLLPFTYSLIGLCTGFLFAWVLWKMGVFAGGDVKLFMALGALNPFTPALIKSANLTNSSIPLFPITLFIYSLIAFLPYGLAVVLYRLNKNREMLKQILKEMKQKIILALHAAIFASAIYALLITLAPTYAWTTLPILLVWGLFKDKKIFLTAIGIIASGVINLNIFVHAAATTIIFSTLAFTLIKFLLSTTRVLTSKIKVSKLEEGMIPAKTIYIEKGKIKEEETITAGKLISLALKGNTKSIIEMLKQKNEIISSKKARGLTVEEIKELKKLEKKGLIPKELGIKESMPFVPTMLLGYLLCLILGDIIFIMAGVI